MTNSDIVEGVAFVLFAWCFPGAYAILSVYLAIITGLGFPLIIGMVVPIVAVWIRVVSKRERRELEQMLKPYKPLSDEERSRIIQSFAEKKREKHA